MFVGGLLAYLRDLCLLAYSGVQHLLCCVFVLFFSTLYTLCCPFFWIVHFVLPLRYSLSTVCYSYVTDNGQMLNSCFKIVNMKWRPSQNVAGLDCVFEIPNFNSWYLYYRPNIYLPTKKQIVSTLIVSSLSKKFKFVFKCFQLLR